jgi:hypothetical protein
VIFEPHDTALTRLGVRFRIGQRYETALEMRGAPAGGVQNSDIPNFIYRWSVREARHPLASFDPIGPRRIRCYDDLRWPSRVSPLCSARSRWPARAAVPIARLVLRITTTQANAVALAIDNLDPRQDLHPWLVADGDRPKLDPAWVHARYDLAAEGQAPTPARGPEALETDAQ